MSDQTSATLAGTLSDVQVAWYLSHATDPWQIALAREVIDSRRALAAAVAARDGLQERFEALRRDILRGYTRAQLVDFHKLVQSPAPTGASEE